MGLQQYRYKFLIVSKNLAIGVLFSGFAFSAFGVLDFSKASRIEAMNGPEFRQYASNYNSHRASLRTQTAIAKKALDLNPQELKISEHATLEILKKKKNCLDCQNRIVFLDLKKNKKLTQSGLEALHKSYELSPYGDEELMKWRLEISSKFWVSLDDELQKSSLTQITALSQFQEGRNWLRGFETEEERIKSRITRLTN